MSTYLEIKDLHKTFYPHGQPLKVLEGIDLEIEKGEIFALRTIGNTHEVFVTLL